VSTFPFLSSFFHFGGIGRKRREATAARDDYSEVTRRKTCNSGWLERGAGLLQRVLSDLPNETSVKQQTIIVIVARRDGR